MHPPTFIDLFAGIGGIRLGLEQAGGRCVFASECDAACQDTYEANFGHRPAGDLTQIPAAEIPDHDILAAGFPCQPFSIIGRGRGFDDTRGTLFFEIERILRHKQPRAFLLENVKQLVSHDEGRTFRLILSRLRALGYVVHWKVLNGLSFGVPQKRERVVIVGFDREVPFAFPPFGRPSTPLLGSLLEPARDVSRRHFVSLRVKQKLRLKVRRRPTGITIWHENKGGHIGIHRFSCALRANASYNYLLVNGSRRLTPREMLRLQGFPDTFRIVVSDSQARRQAGNSVVVPKIEAVARAMLAAMGHSWESAAERRRPVRSRQGCGVHAA